MIPAILSCIYVIYLYLSLNQSETVDAGEGEQVSTTGPGVGDANALLNRVNAIQDRLAVLAKKMESRS